jgi:hypothetical protein
LNAPHLILIKDRPKREHLLSRQEVNTSLIASETISKQPLATTAAVSETVVFTLGEMLEAPFGSEPNRLQPYSRVENCCIACR